MNKKALFNFKPLMLKEENKEKGFVATNDRLFSKSTAPFYFTSIVFVIGIILIEYYDIIKNIITLTCPCQQNG